jgi:hypothetical protein
LTSWVRNKAARWKVVLLIIFCWSLDGREIKQYGTMAVSWALIGVLFVLLSLAAWLVTRYGGPQTSRTVLSALLAGNKTDN